MRDDGTNAGMQVHHNPPVVSDTESTAKTDTRLSAGNGVARDGGGGGTLVDTASIIERIGGDAGLFDRLVTLFGAHCPALLESIRRDLDAHDATALQRDAHTLKGSVMTFTMDGPYHPAFLLETMGRQEVFDGADMVYGRLVRETGRLLADLGFPARPGSRDAE